MTEQSLWVRIRTSGERGKHCISVRGAFSEDSMNWKTRAKPGVFEIPAGTVETDSRAVSVSAGGPTGRFVDGGWLNDEVEGIMVDFEAETVVLSRRG